MLAARSMVPALLFLGLTTGAVQAATAADYVTIRHEVVVERSADQVWARIGDYCGIAEWLKVTCAYASGTGDVGTVRSLNGGATLEPMVGKTARSYTYGQTLGGMAQATYHGTLAVEPDGKKRSHLFYTLFYDQATMASDAVRQSEHARLDKRFGDALVTMKNLAEAK